MLAGRSILLCLGQRRGAGEAANTRRWRWSLGFNETLTEDRFDQLTERLTTASLSRRGAIGLIGGVFAGAVASASFGIERVAAQPGQLPQQIYVIRHGEKPHSSSGPPFGVDFDGNRNADSLSPRG